MGRRLERWRWRQLALLTSSRGVRDAPRKPSATCLDPSDPSKTFKQPVSSFPTPRKPSNNLFHHFRPLGNFQTTCFIISEPSETFKQPVSSFPSPQKPSNNLFHHFRALRNLQTTCFIISDPSGRLRTPANLAGGVRDAGQESRIHVARNGARIRMTFEWCLNTGNTHSPPAGRRLPRT